MSLDKTLFKALRAGGLGHKAALLLADTGSKYALRPIDSDNGPFQELQIQINNVALIADRYAPVSSESMTTQDNRLMVPLVAGSVVSLRHSQYDPPSTVYYPVLNSLTLEVRKLADASGVPIAVDYHEFHGSRDAVAAAVTLPTSQTGYTVSEIAGIPSLGFQVTFANAGWYMLDAYSQKAS